MSSTPWSASSKRASTSGAVWPDVAGHQAGPVGLDEVAALDDAEGAVDLGEQPGDGGLPGAGVAGEDQVAALVERRAGPRSSRIRCTRSRLVTSFTSCFTPSSPTRASSSASSSSSGRAGGSSVAGVALAAAAAAAVVAWRPAGLPGRLHRLDGAEQHAAEPLDGGQLVLGGVEVDGGDRERQLDGVRRSSARAWRGAAAASAASSTSNIAEGWSAKSRWASTSPELAEGVRGRAGELRVEERAERAEHLPQLVVADRGGRAPPARTRG